MSIRDIIETLKESTIWGSLSFSERVEGVKHAIAVLRSYNISVEEDISVIDLVGEVYSGV